MARVFRRGDSGSWYCWVLDDRGKLIRRSTKCTDKRAAEQRAAQMEREQLDPAAAVARKTTVRSLLEDYIRSRQRMNRAADTVEFVRKKSANLVDLLPVAADKITHTVMEQYIDARRGDGVRNTTILKELRVFGAAWRLGLRNGRVRAPLDALMPELDDDARACSRFPSPWELVGLALVLPSRRMAQVAFAVACGAEWGAVGRARAEDVSADLIMVHVRGTKRRTRDRFAVLALSAQRTLMAWALMNADGGAGGKLFSAWPNVRNDLAKACKLLGVARLSPNDLRRAYGSWLRAEGAEPNVIGTAMGHADSRMVERVYGRLPPDALRRLLLQQTGGLQ